MAHQVMTGGLEWDGARAALNLPTVGRAESEAPAGLPRLSKTCFHYLGEFGEDQIYEAHQQGRGTLEALLCGGPRGACSEKVPDTRTELESNSSFPLSP